MEDMVTKEEMKVQPLVGNPADADQACLNCTYSRRSDKESVHCELIGFGPKDKWTRHSWCPSWKKESKKQGIRRAQGAE